VASRNKGTETPGKTTTTTHHHPPTWDAQSGGFSSQLHGVPGDTGTLSTSRSGHRLHRFSCGRLSMELDTQTKQYWEKRDEETRPMTMMDRAERAN
jgi:hypothetical protein